MLIRPNLNKPHFKIFPDAAKAVEEGKCPFCHAEIREEDFRDELSKQEYSVSGLCMKCQDDIFS